MLTDGARSQTQVLREIGEWPIIDDRILRALGPEWQGGFLTDGASALAVAQKGKVGALIHVGRSDFHMVVIEPAGAGFLVRDPLPGMSYTVDSDWIQQWIVGGYWR
jgi:hypothetical protein